MSPDVSATPSPGAESTVARWHFIAVTGLLALSTHTTAEVAETSALFTANSTAATSRFTGATFTPRVAPVITPTITARSVSLAWTEVQSAKSVAYTVTRTGPVGTSTQVCTGANLPTVSQGTVRCTDTTATSGVSYTYSQQPFLDIANSTPWSLPASSSSSSVSAPRLSYIDSGPDASSTGPAVTVQYPASVELGTLWQAILASVGDSFVARHDAPSIFAGHYDPSFSLGLCMKDLGLIGELSERVAAELPMTRAATSAFQSALERYGPDAAELHVARRIEDDAGISLRLDGDWTPPWEQ
ncbi:MAG: hypothetical protein EBY93_01615 [Actinobacteria bacterium]|nr:hypothetical protein [Actinomycetota bacterium]